MTFWDGTRWVPGAPAPGPARPRRGRRFLGATAEALLITGLIFGLIAGTTLAAKGGNGGGKGKATGTVTLLILDGEDAVPNHDERVGFDVSTTADRPFVGVRCWQGGDFVLDAYTGYFEDYTGDPWVTLGSPYWRDGEAADCTARLFQYDKRGNQKVLATTDFLAAP